MINITQPNDCLPHKYPFLFVDKIVDQDDNRIVGIKNVSINEPFFQGHYPNNPVMPTSLVLESLTQTASILLLSNHQLADRKPICTEIHNAKFNKPVVPGDQLRLEIEIKKSKDTTLKCEGIALVDGQIICETSFTYTLTTKPSTPQVHPTATVHPTAVLGKDVIIGPNSIIGEEVTIGDNTIIESNVCIEKWTQIGEDCHIHYGSVIGSPPQDTSYKGEKSWVVIGDRNQIREYVTINRASGKNNTTQIGNDNIFLTSVHLAHNCQVGNNVTIVNMANIAGHTIIEDYVTIGGMTGVHQFVRIGKYAMIGAYTRLPQDIPPYMLCEGNPAIIRGLNLIGLKRNGFSFSTIKEIKELFKLFYRSEKNTSQVFEELKKITINTPESEYLINFMKTESKRGINKKADSIEA